MNDDELVSSYNLKNVACIHLVVSLRPMPPRAGGSSNMAQSYQARQFYQREDVAYLCDKENKKSIPLLTCGFQVDIAQGYADTVINQLYENATDKAIETMFMMPTTSWFTVNSLKATFHLKDGTKEVLETRVVEKEKAQIEYDDAMA